MPVQPRTIACAPSSTARTRLVGQGASEPVDVGELGDRDVDGARTAHFGHEFRAFTAALNPQVRAPEVDREGALPTVHHTAARHATDQVGVQPLSWDISAAQSHDRHEVEGEGFEPPGCAVETHQELSIVAGIELAHILGSWAARYRTSQCDHPPTWASSSSALPIM
jgi:hypothetical protein